MDTNLIHGNGHWPEWLSSAGTSYLLIFSAEIGDKSQLICMTLASRYKALPVFLGAVCAFSVLNLLAVLFGTAIANWIPEFYVSVLVSLLFLGFGFYAWNNGDGEEEEEAVGHSNHSIFITTFLLIAIAEFGDKTQLAVVALSSTGIPSAVMLAATLALATTSLLGVWAGRTVLQKIPIHFLHKTSAVLFILIGTWAAYKSYTLL